MRASISRSRFLHTFVVIAVLLSVALCASPAMSQTEQPQTKPAQSPAGRSPSDTIREFYRLLREKKYREAFDMSIFKPAVDGLKPEEFEDLRPDFEKVALAISEKIPAKVDIAGEQISGSDATVFVNILDSEGKPTTQPAPLLLVNGVWIVGDRESQQVVKKAGKRYFFDTRIDAHHGDVQDMLTRISLAELLYSQQHEGRFADLATLISLGLLPKDLEGTESTGYRFHVNAPNGGKTWNAAAEPAQYGRSGKLSFYLDAAGVRNGDIGGKPLTPEIKN
ncbi:MAG: hypothetical protein ACRD9S_01100 [Pyrinomonadaceae bacterium]